LPSLKIKNTSHFSNIKNETFCNACITYPFLVFISIPLIVFFSVATFLWQEALRNKYFR